MVGMRRFTWRIFRPVEVVEVGGVKSPSTRKDLMLERRRSEEALGERRIMGSGRREEGVGLLGRRAGVMVVWGAAAAAGVEVGFWRRRKASEYLRTWEKSCWVWLVG